MVLLDEVSWLAHYDGAFADDLKVAWDNLFKKHDRLVMVLCDNYSRFFLKYVEPAAGAIDAGSFEIARLESLEGFESVMGLAFANLVANHVRDLLPFLNLKGALVVSAAPWRRKGAKSGRGRKGCQIDLLVQTRRTACVVEIKRRREIGREIIDETDAKIKALSLPPGVSARAALVYDGDLSPVVEADGYFDAIVPFRKLMGL